VAIGSDMFGARCERILEQVFSQRTTSTEFVKYTPTYHQLIGSQEIIQKKIESTGFGGSLNAISPTVRFIDTTRCTGIAGLVQFILFTLLRKQEYAKFILPGTGRHLIPIGTMFTEFDPHQTLGLSRYAGNDVNSACYCVTAIKR